MFEQGRERERRKKPEIEGKIWRWWWNRVLFVSPQTSIEACLCQKCKIHEYWLWQLWITACSASTNEGREEFWVENCVIGILRLTPGAEPAVQLPGEMWSGKEEKTQKSKKDEHNTPLCWGRRLREIWLVEEVGVSVGDWLWWLDRGVVIGVGHWDGMLSSQTERGPVLPAVRPPHQCCSPALTHTESTQERYWK